MLTKTLTLCFINFIKRVLSTNLIKLLSNFIFELKSGTENFNISSSNVWWKPNSFLTDSKITRTAFKE